MNFKVLLKASMILALLWPWVAFSNKATVPLMELDLKDLSVQKDSEDDKLIKDKMKPAPRLEESTDESGIPLTASCVDRYGRTHLSGEAGFDSCIQENTMLGNLQRRNGEDSVNIKTKLFP